MYSLGPRLTASGPRRRLAFVVHRTSCPAPALPVCPPSVWSCLSLRITVYPVHQLAYDQRHLLHSSYVAGKIKKTTATRRSGNHSVASKKKPAVQCFFVSPCLCSVLPRTSRCVCRRRSVHGAICTIGLTCPAFSMSAWESLPNETGYVLLLFIPWACQKAGPNAAAVQ